AEDERPSEDFDWDHANAEHVAAHGVSREEAEAALCDPGREFFAARSGTGESRRAIVGRTDAGAYLYVVFTQRGIAVRVVTARPATAGEKRAFRKRKGWRR